MILAGTGDLAILTDVNREMSRYRNREEFQRLKYAKKIKLSAHLNNAGNSRTMTLSTSTFSTTLSRCSVTPMVICGICDFSYLLTVTLLVAPAGFLAPEGQKPGGTLGLPA